MRAKSTMAAGEQVWDEAYSRVESYLGSLRIAGRLRLAELTSEIIDEAKRVVADQNGSPVTTAMQVMQDRLDVWYAAMNRTTGPIDDRVRNRSRLALVMAAQNESWTRDFLAKEPSAEIAAAALGTAPLQAGPEVHFSNMPPAPLEFDSPASRETLEPGMKSVFVRAAGLWLAIIGLMGITWAASH